MSNGSRAYGLGAIAMGLAFAVFHALAMLRRGPGPAMSVYDVLAFISAAILVSGGVLVNLRGPANVGAAALAAWFGLSALTQAIPPLVAGPMVMVNWQKLAELSAMAAGGMVAYALAPGVPAVRSAKLAQAGVLAFGLCLLVFGASHFVYARLTASLVPAWLPPGQLIWTYVTGAAQIAAGAALLSNIRPRLAAQLLAAMYGVFAFLVHAPLILGAPSLRGNWDELCETLVLAGAAWVIADGVGRSARR
jgi:hypothetical protein